MARAGCCQGGRLRAWISAVVVVQCALILLYWDATRAGSGGSRPLRLQAKASHEHLRAQASPDAPEAAARHFRHHYDEAPPPTDAPPGGGRGNQEGRGDPTGGADRKGPTPGDHGNDLKADTGKGELISPETELLLFKPANRRKYPGPDKHPEQNLSPAADPRAEGLQVVLDKSSRLVDTNSVNQTGVSKEGVANLTQSSRLLFQSSKQKPLYKVSKPESGALIFGPSNRVPESGVSNNHGIETSIKDSANLKGRVRPTSGSQRSWFTPKAIIRQGAAVILKAFSSQLPTHAQQSPAGQNEQLHKAEGEEPATQTKPHTPGQKDIHLGNPTAETSKTVKYQNDNKTVEGETTTSASTPSTPTTTTNNPWLAAHLQRKKALYPTFETPMPRDPYSPNVSNLVYTVGTHEEFHRLTPDLPQVFHLPRGDDVFPKYFLKNGAESCFSEGTASAGEQLKVGESVHHDGCLCKRGWHGRHCSIPEGVFSSTGARFVESLKPRNTSRRIISALAFNVEFELLEARLYELDDVVDVFIILESNYTNYGDPKPLLLLQRLREGYLKEFHHKIIYLFRGKIPQGGREDGWLVDQHMRMYIGQEGMSRVFNSTPDDIFLYTDADEIPNREAILFLRIHDGYSEPIGVALRWSVFGFFWKQFDATRVVIGCTVGMFRYVFSNDAYQLRSTDYQTQASSKLHAYIASGAFIYDWHMGDNGALAGWHCSWCLLPERIRVKLTSAINADFPRWGDFPEKLELPYLRSLVKTGTWFDDKSRFGMLVHWQSEEQFAPKYVLKNPERYKYLLDLDDT